MQFVAIILIYILNGLETNICAPTMPAIQQEFGLTTFEIEMMMCVNLIAICIGALLSGGLGDKCGIKKIALYGQTIFTISSYMCAITDSYSMFLVGRFLQGLGIAAPYVLCGLLILKQYPQDGQRKVFGVLNSIFTLSLSVGPVIGSNIGIYFNWRVNFWILFFGSLIASVIFYYSVKEDDTRSDDSISFADYYKIFRNKEIMSYLMAMGSIISMFIIFSAIAPILYIQDLGVSSQLFGIHQGLVTASFAIFSMCSELFIKRIGPKNSIKISLLCMQLFAIGVVYALLTNTINVVFITGLMCFISITSVFLINISYPIMLSIAPSMNGKISATSTALRLLISSVVIQAIGYFYTHDFVALGIALFGLSIISSTSFLLMIYKLRLFKKI